MMDIWHRIGYNVSAHPRWERSLQSLAIPYRALPLPGRALGTILFDITEEDPHWTVIAEQFVANGASDVYDTVFTPEEIEAAEWVRLVPVFEQGYPHPRGEFAWHDLVREGTCGCCGLGFVQKAPFHLAKEPHLGKNDFISLYGTYAVFCSQRVRSVFDASGLRGYQASHAIIHGTGKPSATVSQLLFQGIAAPGLIDLDKARPETCLCCGLTKYAAHMRGYMRMKRGALPEQTDFVQSHEWFGSGGYGGYREILISSRVARSILQNQWRGVRLKPIILV